MIEYHKGDCLENITRPTIIAHVTNDMGGWGAGFSGALSRKWEGPERYYRTTRRHQLGENGYVFVEQLPRVAVCNMCAQHSYASRVDPVAVDYVALEECLANLFRRAAKEGLEVRMPKIGAGLGGGNWDEISRIINSVSGDVVWHVYTLE